MLVYTPPSFYLQRRQRGVVLFVMLMLLIVMSLLVAWSVKMVTFETKITANQAFKDQSFIRAENAVTTMENCLTGAIAPSASECRVGGVDITANTVFNGTVPGFLSRALNPVRTASSYWTGSTNQVTSTNPAMTKHDWNAASQSAVIAVAGSATGQQARIVVERQNQTDLSGFSRDSASQGFDLGFATPFRITANSADAGATAAGVRSIVQTVVFVPTAAITTPE